MFGESTLLNLLSKIKKKWIRFLLDKLRSAIREGIVTKFEESSWSASDGNSPLIIIIIISNAQVGQVRFEAYQLTAPYTSPHEEDSSSLSDFFGVRNNYPLELTWRPMLISSARESRGRDFAPFAARLDAKFA